VRDDKLSALIVLGQADAQAGDRTAAQIRWIHEGSRGTTIIRPVFLTGTFPIVFRRSCKRSGRKASGAARAAQLNPARMTQDHEIAKIRWQSK